MLRCNRCGAMWLTSHLTLHQKKKLTKRHDQECPALPVGGETE